VSNNGARARRRAVPAAEPAIAPAKADYADSFEITVSEDDFRTPEQLFRAALAQARWMRRLVPVVHRYLLGFRLGPASSPEHLLGWRIGVSTPDVIALEAVSPLARGVIVGRKSSGAVSFTTYLYYARAVVAAIIWALVAPLHRAVALHLMELGAAAPPRKTATSSSDAGAGVHGMLPKGPFTS
jgi:hypothetical protein